MSPTADSIGAGALEPAAAPPPVLSIRFVRRRLFDQLARRAVTLGGLVIIASILAILFVIAGETYPLLRPARVRALAPVAAKVGSLPLAIESDEYRSQAVIVAEGGVWSIPLAPGGSATRLELAELGSAKVSSASAAGHHTLALGLSDGRVLPLEIVFP